MGGVAGVAETFRLRLDWGGERGRMLVSKGVSLLVVLSMFRT